MVPHRPKYRPEPISDLSRPAAHARGTSSRLAVGHGRTTTTTATRSGHRLPAPPRGVNILSVPHRAWSTLLALIHGMPIPPCLAYRRVLRGSRAACSCNASHALLYSHSGDPGAAAGAAATSIVTLERLLSATRSPGAAAATGDTQTSAAQIRAAAEDVTALPAAPRGIGRTTTHAASAWVVVLPVPRGAAVRAVTSSATALLRAASVRVLPAAAAAPGLRVAA